MINQSHSELVTFRYRKVFAYSVTATACYVLSRARRLRSAISKISIIIINYTEKNERLIVLIYGVEYLVSRFGFESVYQILQTKRSQTESANNVLVITLYKEALDPRQIKLLERELQNLSQA